jgi:hypothetical protein
VTSSQTPYANLPDTAFWRRAVASMPASGVDPIGQVPFVLTRTDRIATAGSCFAVHLSRHLSKSGFNYFVTEPGHPFLGAVAAEFNYGAFSARYGNIYTSRQLLQLFDRAYGTFTPAEDVWHNGEGRYFDPFRPNIQPNGFSSEREYWEDRHRHLAAVRQLFEQLDVLVFTLGLTEGWLSREDGAAFTLCPGVAAGTFDPERHQFHNLTCQEVIADLEAFIQKLRQVNPGARVILTVSPVPIIATMEPRHVLVSNAYTKCALRAACDGVVGRFSGMAYFPGYEIVTSNYTRGCYFADDLRSVTPDGVDHVMTLFYQHYGAAAIGEESPVPAGEEARTRAYEDRARLSEQVNEVLCDEEMLDSEAASG